MPKSTIDPKSDDNRLNFKVKLAATGRKRSKKTTDPLKPRRPPSAFFVFMSEFRVKYSHSNKISGVSVVSKAGSEEWKAMSYAEKAPYFAKVGKMKEEYEKIKRAYNDAEKKKEEDYEEIIRAYNVRLPGDYGTVFTPVSTTKKINLMADTSSHGRSLKMLEMRSFPSTSSANESSSSVEIRGVQSKLSGSHATPTQSFDSCQPIATILPENYASGDDNYASDDEDDQTVIDEKVPSDLDTVRAGPQPKKFQYADVVMKEDTVIFEETTTLKRVFQEVDPYQDPMDDLLHQAEKDCNSDTVDTDPANDLLSLLTDPSQVVSMSGMSSPVAEHDSRASKAMELFKELKGLMSKPLDIASADISACNQMRMIVEELNPLKQLLPLSSQITLEQINNFLTLLASKNALLRFILPVYEQAVKSKDDLVKKLLSLKEEKDKIAADRKQQEAVKVKAEEKVVILKKQLALAEAELAEAHAGIGDSIEMEKKRVHNINALRTEVNQTATTLKNLRSDYESAMSTKKDLEDLLSLITQSSSPWYT
ncbi:unnamed protein product [Vicia faba]|uniref:HMG box domain-containing protein n=1 Tax=Vicia faba TaxID=3906 RepID=A0AAV1AVX2_VICFA|nr:unnamed protein product [Vicia faba]